MIESFNLIVQLQTKSDLFNEISEIHDYKLAVNDMIDDINIEIFKQFKAMSLQAICEKLLENAVIIINLFEHTNLAISNNINESCYTEIDKIIINFLSKYVNNFIFYKADSQFKVMNVVILCNNCSLCLEIIYNNFKKVCPKWDSIIYAVKKD